MNLAVPNERFLHAAVCTKVGVASSVRAVFIDDLDLNFTSASSVTLPLGGGERLYLVFGDREQNYIREIYITTASRL